MSRGEAKSNSPYRKRSFSIITDSGVPHGASDISCGGEENIDIEIKR